MPVLINILTVFSAWQSWIVAMLKVFCAFMLTFPVYYQEEILTFLALVLVVSILCSDLIFLIFQSSQAQKHLNHYPCCISWFLYRYLIIDYIFALKSIWSFINRSTSVFLISVKQVPFTPHFQFCILDICFAWDSSYIDLVFFMSSGHLSLQVMIFRHLLYKIYLVRILSFVTIHFILLPSKLCVPSPTYYLLNFYEFILYAFHSILFSSFYNNSSQIPTLHFDYIHLPFPNTSKDFLLFSSHPTLYVLKKKKN